MQDTLVPFLGQEDPPEKGKATHSSIGLPGGSDSKESTYNVGGLSVWSLGWEDPLEEGKANILYSGLETSSRTRLSDLHLTGRF